MDNNFIEVIELSSSEETNAYLGNGWKLINTYVTCDDTIAERVGNQSLYYVLAWDSAVGDTPVHV